jgi:sugar (pentulose or hexulose) kinase
MMKNQSILGVDSSTSATKVIAFGTNGKTLAEGTSNYPIYTENPGWVEQNAESWWEAFKTGCQQVVSNPNVDVKKITGIGFTHQRFTFVPVDHEIRPLRKAILWNDLRCAKEAEYARQVVGEQKIFERTGYPPGQWTLYKVLWLKNHEPELYDKMYKIVLVQDYLIYKLTGNLIMAEGSGTMTGALDIAHPKQWAMDIIKALGVRENIWVEKILSGATIAGYVTQKTAQETGLPVGLPVFTGAGDQPCGSLGAGITQAGELGINGGTSCSNEFVVRDLPERKSPNYFIEISPSGDYIVENDIPSGGSAVMNWYKNNFGSYEMRLAEKEQKNVWEIIYSQVDESLPGNWGLMIVPYLQGVYGPYWDQNARAVIFGLQTDHGRAHLIRGLLEGVAYEARREVEMMEAGSGMHVEQIKMYGGSARSDQWNQIFTDMFNKPLHVPETAETTALGAAISAAVGCGLYNDFKKAVNAMVSIKKSYQPIAKNALRYEKFYRGVYVKLYESVRAFTKTIVEINEEFTD